MCKFFKSVLLTSVSLMIFSSALKAQLCKGFWSDTTLSFYLCAYGPYPQYDSGANYCPSTEQLTFSFTTPAQSVKMRFAGFGTWGTNSQSRMAMFINGSKVDLGQACYISIGCQTPAGAYSIDNGCMVDSVGGLDGGLSGYIYFKASDFGVPSISTVGLALSEPFQSGTLFEMEVCNRALVDLGPNKILCEGDTFLLNANFPGATFLWEDGSTNPVHIVTQTGTYWVDVSTNNCVSRDSIHFTFNPLPVFDIGNDTTLCFGQILQLDATAPGSTYLWQDSTTFPHYTITEEGTYWVRVLLSNCSRTDTLHVNYLNFQAVDLGADTIVCSYDSLVLNVSDPGSAYLWQDGSTDSVYTINHGGTYWVQLSAAYCSRSDTITVNFETAPDVFLGNDTTLCRRLTLTLDATAPNTLYLWQDFSGGPMYTVSQGGTYWVQVHKGHCNGYDTINIEQIDCKVILEMPNVFTPNGDGYNDLFLPLDTEGIVRTKMYIYNRWGKKVFASYDIMGGWDGRSHGDNCTEGTYYWIIQYADIFSEESSLNGIVTLMR
ncbi:MAG: gliding motility-associated C-terminal domain-containing protein [Bacteroidota bacterium]